MNKPLVSIVSLTFSHEKYIRDTLNGFIIQKTNFEFEIIIHDDASTDKTQDIIKEYEKKHPNIFRPIYQKVNQKSKQSGNVTRIVFNAAKGKYIALCEGDDYWTDPNKLQKQVDFLEKNPEYSMCFHHVKIVDESNRIIRDYYGQEGKKNSYVLEDLFAHNFIPTCSVVFRSEMIYDLPEWFGEVSFGDWVLHILNAKRGKIGFLNEVMGVYRSHPSGMWSNLPKIEKLKREINTFNIVGSNLKLFSNFKFRKMVARRYLKLSVENRNLNRKEKSKLAAWKSFLLYPFDLQALALKILLLQYFPFLHHFATFFRKLSFKNSRN